MVSFGKYINVTACWKEQAKNSGFLYIMAARNPQSRGQAINRHMFYDREKMGTTSENGKKAWVKLSNVYHISSKNYS